MPLWDHFDAGERPSEMAAKTSPSRRRTAELCGSDDGPEFDACDYKKGLLLGKYRFLLEAAKQV